MVDIELRVQSQGTKGGQKLVNLNPGAKIDLQ